MAAASWSTSNLPCRVPPMSVMRSRRLYSAASALLLLLASLPGLATPRNFVPGLGEFMSATQMRHIKLWFAGAAGNWPLASYELDELAEGFADIVAFHPRHPGSPIAVANILPRLTAAPLAALRTAIESRNRQDFSDAFDSLTAACNACHEAENFGFNRIRRPQNNPYTDQEFDPVTKPAAIAH